MTIFSGIHANNPNSRFLAPGTLDHAHKLGSGEYEYLPRLRGTTTHPLPSSEAALRYSHQASEHHRSLSSSSHIPFLTPDKPESFREILKDGRGAHEFEFAVDDVYGTEIIVNTDSKVAVSYTLSSQFDDPVWGAYNWTSRGLVTPGEPIDTIKLFQPGEKYKLTIKFGDVSTNSEVEGHVTVHHSDAAQAARFARPPRGSNLDHYRGSSIFNKYPTVPIKVGDTYKDQQFSLNLGGGCYTVYPCRGQERVRVSTTLEDRLFTKYGRIRFSNRISNWENQLNSIFQHSETEDESRSERADHMYTYDTDEPISSNGTVKREYFNDFFIGSGAPTIICVAAPNAVPTGTDTMSIDHDKGEQYLFPFSVTSLDGNHECDLAKEFNWEHLTPGNGHHSNWLRDNLKFIGPAAGAGLLAMAAAFYHYRSKSRPNLPNLTAAPEGGFVQREARPSIVESAESVSDDLRVEEASDFDPASMNSTDYTLDFSNAADLTDAELTEALKGQQLTTLILKGCSSLTDASWDTIGKQEYLVELDLSGCANMSADGFLDIMDNLPNLESCYIPTDEAASDPIESNETKLESISPAELSSRDSEIEMSEFHDAQSSFE